MADSKHIPDEALADTLDYVLQLHTQASRGGRSHADFRFGSELAGAESYAIPKGRLPDVAEKLLAVNTEIHPYEYMRFQGSYGHGRRRNKVEISENGKISVRRDKDGSSVLEIVKDGRRYRLVRAKKGNKDGWVMIGLPSRQEKTASEKSYNFISGKFLDCRTVKTLANLLIIQPLTTKTLKKGMGGRESLPSGLGMLFLNCRTFWMKDVPFDIELVRLDRNFVVTEIQPMKGSFLNLDLPTYFPKSRKSVHALEVPAGYCEAKGIKIGDLFRVRKGV